MSTNDYRIVSEGEDVIHNKHDKGYKFLLSSKRVFIQLLRSFVKHGWVDKVNENNMIRIDKSYILRQRIRSCVST